MRDLEILMNPAYKWDAANSHGALGDGSSWQMVVSTHRNINPIPVSRVLGWYLVMILYFLIQI